MKKLKPETDKLAATLERTLSLNKAILSASLDAIITINTKGEVIEFNDAATHIFGWRKEEIIGQHMEEYIIPPELRAAHLAGMQHYLATGEGPVLDNRMELPALHKEGHRFPIEIAISPLITDSDTMFVAFIRDITDYKVAETELRLAAQTFDSDEAITITDKDHKIIRVNNAFTRITGYEASEVLGKNHRILASGLHGTQFYQDMWQQLLERGNWSGEIYNKRKDGEIFPEHLNISAVKDAEGEITHYVAHFVDISKHKEHEQQLREARHKAEAANNAKGLFLANMSHEIRTPITGVLGILDLLMDTSLDLKQQHLVKTGRESGEHLLNIINDILDYSKMDADHLDLDYISFDLHGLLDSIVEFFRPQAENKHLGFALENSQTLVQYVKGDPSRLRQILINLISNALKFTDQGGVKIKASSTPDKQSNSKLRVSIEDTGIGIAPEYSDSLFDVFTMADQSHTRISEGSGLGLAICKQLVTLMSGSISFVSKVGKGSRFYFEIELGNGDPSEINNNHQIYGLRLQPKENIRVLLAEDNLANQAVIKGILEHAGLIVDIVCNGQEAVEAVRTGSYDIVLMDISMPIVDGIEATRRIRRLADGPNDIPIIAITAHALLGDRERFLEAGMDDYLTKPVERGTMLRVIAHLADAYSMPRRAVDENHDDTDPPDAEHVDELVNESVLLQLARDTGTEVLPKLLNLYTQDARTRLSRIKEAVIAKDYQILEFESHTLGSSAGAHGNLRLQQIARQIEHLCQKNEQELATERAIALLEIAEASRSYWQNVPPPGLDNYASIKRYQFRETCTQGISVPDNTERLTLQRPHF